MKCEVCGIRKAALRIHSVGEDGVAERSMCFQCGEPYTVQPMEMLDAEDGDVHFRIYLLPKEMFEGCERSVPLFRWTACQECGGPANAERSHSCSRCKGLGMVSDRVSLRVKIPAHVAASKVLRVQGHGNVRRADLKRGDVYLHVAGVLELVV